MRAKKPKMDQTKPGGVNIKGNVNVKGDFIEGDKNISLGTGSVYISGNVEKSNIITGDETNLSKINVVRNELFENIFKKIDARPETPLEDKTDLKDNVREIKTEAEKGDQANESFLASRLRNIKRMAPDILEVVIAAIANPAAGFTMVIKKIADHAKASVSNSEAKA